MRGRRSSRPTTITGVTRSSSASSAVAPVSSHEASPTRLRVAATAIVTTTDRASTSTPLRAPLRSRAMRAMAATPRVKMPLPTSLR